MKILANEDSFYPDKPVNVPDGTYMGKMSGFQVSFHVPLWAACPTRDLAVSGETQKFEFKSAEHGIKGTAQCWVEIKNGKVQDVKFKSDLSNDR